MDSRRLPRICALAVICAGAGLAAGLAATLPADAATHFSASGAADGRMSRLGFAVTMFGLCAALPISCLFGLSALRAPARPSLPPSGRYALPIDGSVAAVSPWAAASFAAGLSVFMDFVAWSVWVANRADPSRLPASALSSGTAVFVGFVCVWAVAVSASRQG